MTTATLNLDMTMSDILGQFPGARRALFQKYHIGGCHSCGFEPSDSLRTVLAKHQVSDTDTALKTILDFDAMDRRMQISAKDTAELRRKNPKVRLVDVRSEEEWEMARIEGAELLTQELFDVLKAAPKDTPIVFHCHVGHRSLDAAAYFIGHGFTDVKSMVGGITAWSDQVDPRVPKY
jgi:rhodanese-related sulfurtransferase